MKYFILPLTLSSILCAEQSFIIEPKGKLQLRYESRVIDYTNIGKSNFNRDNTSYDDYIFGGMFGLQTTWKDYKLNTILYGTQRLHSKNGDPLKNEKPFYDNDMNSFLYLGEANIKRDFQNHSFTVGRQTYNTSLVNNNFRITKNTYEGIEYKYKDEKVEFSTFYFNKVASSTSANSVPYDHPYGFLGYGLGYNTGGFEKISKHIINKDLPTNGALHFLFKYGEKANNIRYENLYVDNFFNISNIALSLNKQNYYLRVGALSQFSVGDDHIEKHLSNNQNKKLKAEHYQLELKYLKKSFGISYYCTLTPYKKDSIYTGTVFSPFSNKASWLSGVNTSHSLISDTTSHQIVVRDTVSIYKTPVHLLASYAKYNIGSKNGLTSSKLDTSEWFVTAKKFFSKELSVKLQHASAKNTNPAVKKSANTKVIVEYNF